jgi:hypothetical protein
MSQSICEVKHDVCSLRDINVRLGNTSAIQIIIDQYGNLEIIDPNNDLGAIYSENEGNLSGNGVKVNNFAIDQFGNFEFIP